MANNQGRDLARHLLSRFSRRVRIGFGTEELLQAGAAEANALARLIESSDKRHKDLLKHFDRIEALSQSIADSKIDLAERTLTFHLPDGRPYSLQVTKIGQDPYRIAIASNGGQEADWCLCLNWLRASETFFDVGANIGAFSIPASVLGAEVHAFELLTENLDMIRASAELNKLETLRLVLGAVWHSSGAVGIAGHSAWGTVHAGARTMVAALRIDDYVAQHSIVRVDMLKLDVEGAERAALTGAMRLIERDHPDILFESNTLTCGAANYSYRALLRMLGEFGYRLFRVGSGVLHPWSGSDVQEIVQTDYLATTRQDEEIAGRCGWPIRALTVEEQAASVLGEDRFGDFHRMHLLAIRDQLPKMVREAADVVHLLNSWSALLDNPSMAVLRTGVA